MHYLCLKVHCSSADRQMVDLLETYSTYMYIAVVSNSGLLMDVERDGLRVTEFDKFNKVILIEFGITCQD